MSSETDIDNVKIPQPNAQLPSNNNGLPAPSSVSLSVDGFAVMQHMKSQQVADTDNCYDPNELRRRIERRDGELKRKEKEILVLQREILSLTNDIKSLRERNEQLQLSLHNARLLTSNAREDQENRIINERIVELETVIEKNEKTIYDTCGELEVCKAENRNLVESMKQCYHELDGKNTEIKMIKDELSMTQLKLRTANIRLNEKDIEMEKVRSTFESSKDIERRLQREVDHYKHEAILKDREIAELSTENKSMKAALMTKNETNSLLRNQMADLNDKSYFISKEELEKFKKFEKENAILQTRSKELIKSVELHMDLLQRAEQENTALKLKLDKTISEFDEYKEDMAGKAQVSLASTQTVDSLKKELVKLRRENKEMAAKIDELLLKKAQNLAVHGNMATGYQFSSSGKNNEEVEVHLVEKQKRKMAEDAMRAMRNRISFLLEQLDQASHLSTSWKEQKAIFKAEVSALHHANLELRERLLSIQKNYMEKTLFDIANPALLKIMPPRTRPSAFLTDDDDPGNTAERMLTSDPPDNVVEIAFKTVAAQPLPTTPAAVVERQIFDVVCAFTTGAHSQDEEGSKNSNNSAQGRYFVQMNVDGLLTIQIDQRGQMLNTRNTEAQELLTGLQIPAFLKFVQTRNPEKIGAMFCEKLASLLNFFRNSAQEYISQIGNAKMLIAKLQAKESVVEEKVVNMKAMFSNERLAKQKSIMKYIREQMRISDLRKVMAEISTKSRESLDEIEVRRKDIINNFSNTGGTVVPDNRHIRDLMNQLMNVADQLAMSSRAYENENAIPDANANDYGIPVGALEIRLPESQVDDESLHGVVGLLCGAIGPAAAAAALEPDQMNETALLMSSADRTNKSQFDRIASKSNISTMQSLNLNATGDRIAAAALFAKTLESIQSNYIDRILLLNLRGNALSDISCKILVPLVESAKALRMLDIRGNLISSHGAKLLFDATRRNKSVVYVTQRQNGLMIEGHREIIDTQKHSNENEGIKLEESEHEPIKSKNEKIYPLRIDIRGNNPEKEAMEKLIECTEYKGRGFRPSATNEGVDSHAQTFQSNDEQFPEMVDDRDNNIKRATFQNYKTTSIRGSPMTTLRPRSAAPSINSSNSSSNHILSNRGVSGGAILKRPTSSGPSINTRINSLQDIHNVTHKSNNDTIRDAIAHDDDENSRGERSDQDDEGYLEDGVDADPHVKALIQIRKQMKTEGMAGPGGVGSLLDMEIRKMQEKYVQEQMNFNFSNTNSSNKINMKMKSKGVKVPQSQQLNTNSNNLSATKFQEVKKTLSAPVIGIKYSAKQLNQPKYKMESRPKSAHKNATNQPINKNMNASKKSVRPVSAPSGRGGGVAQQQKKGLGGNGYGGGARLNVTTPTLIISNKDLLQSVKKHSNTAILF